MSDTVDLAYHRLHQIRAHQLWKEAGCPPGNGVSFWRAAQNHIHVPDNPKRLSLEERRHYHFQTEAYLAWETAGCPEGDGRNFYEGAVKWSPPITDRRWHAVDIMQRKEEEAIKSFLLPEGPARKIFEASGIQPRDDGESAHVALDLYEDGDFSITVMTNCFDAAVKVVFGREKVSYAGIQPRTHADSINHPDAKTPRPGQDFNRQIEAVIEPHGSGFQMVWCECHTIYDPAASRGSAKQNILFDHDKVIPDILTAVGNMWRIAKEFLDDRRNDDHRNPPSLPFDLDELFRPAGKSFRPAEAEVEVMLLEKLAA